ASPFQHTSHGILDHPLSRMMTPWYDTVVNVSGHFSPKRWTHLEPHMPSDAPAWSLHSRLKEDTIDIGDLPLCRVLVIKDAHYPWLLLVPRRPDPVEIIDLDEGEQAQLMTEINRVARALKEITQCDKLNIAALGNAVPQLHVHVIARFRADAAGARAVWGAAPTRPYEATQLTRLVAALKGEMGLA